MIKSVNLGQFKKHSKFNREIDSKLVLLHGDNASGKTSILEAISLFSPGAGIFNKDLDQLIEFDKNAFEIYITSEHKMHMLYLNDRQKLMQKKEFTINQTAVKPMQLPEYIRIYGLNPYLAFAFWKDSTIKRKHIDRLIMQHDLRYATLAAKYTKAMLERNKLIEMNQFNMHMQNLYNPILIETGLAITKIRTEVLNKISNELPDSIKDFLGSNLYIEISPTLEEQEKIFSNKLEPYFLGPHKTKFNLYTQHFNSANASTGQQKKLLLALTLAALPKNDITSVLLLDDLFANLDAQTIEQLLFILNEQHFQTWISNIEDISFNNLSMEICMQKIHLK